MWSTPLVHPRFARNPLNLQCRDSPTFDFGLGEGFPLFRVFIHAVLPADLGSKDFCTHQSPHNNCSSHTPVSSLGGQAKAPHLFFSLLLDDSASHRRTSNFLSQPPPLSDVRPEKTIYINAR